jgi:hypothetical protein
MVAPTSMPSAIGLSDALGGGARGLTAVAERR